MKQIAGLTVKMGEDWLRSLYLEAALRLGFTEQYHTYDSRRSDKGFPDDVLCSRDKGRVLFIEAKSEDGKLRPEQEVWVDTLAWCDQEVYIWYPKHWDSGEIVEILTLSQKPSKRHRAQFDSAVVKLP